MTTEQVCKNCTNWLPSEIPTVGPYECEGSCTQSVTKLKTFPRDTCLLFELKNKKRNVLFPGEEIH
jgi:hypothetical protein